MSCIFCDIAKGGVRPFVWEDEKHVAFITPFPNTPGVTVVITKEHHSSYIFDLPEPVRAGLVEAAGKVAKLLDKLPGVGRTALVFEGFGVNHIHAKLYPLHGTDIPEWKPINSNSDSFTETYQGCISSHDGPRWDEARLLEMTNLIKGEE